MRFFSLATILPLAILCCSPISAVRASNDVISSNLAQQAGLQVHWYSHLQVDAARDKLVDIELHIHNDRSLTYFELLHGNQREVISENDLSLRGERFGITGASEWANLRKEILESEGHQVRINQITVPLTTLYSFNESGVIEATDAETGRQLWVQRVGRPNYPSEGIAVNDQFVVAVKGSKVFCLDSSNGEIIWTRKTRSAPGGGVGVSNQVPRPMTDDSASPIVNYAYVTQLGGIVEAFPLNSTGYPTQFLFSVGRAISDPVITASTVSWPTDAGHYNVAELDNFRSLAFRLQTGVKIPAPGAATAGRLIVVTKLGKVFGIDEDRGKVAWEFATGELIDKAPIAIGGKYALILTEHNHLHAIDVMTGGVVSGWAHHVPDITQFVGASGELLYFLDVQNRLVALRKTSGSRAFALEIGSPDLIVTNTRTDRLYFGDLTGGLVCVREIANENAMFHSSESEIPSTPEGRQLNPFDVGGEQPTEPTETPKPTTNPFQKKGG